MINKDFVKFLGFDNKYHTYAMFEITPHMLPDGSSLEGIIVEHEGRWTDPVGMSCHPEYETYEAVQEDLGEGLSFVRKEYSAILRRSLIEYVITDPSHVILAVPATGEEIGIKLYGTDRYHDMCLLFQGEL